MQVKSNFILHIPKNVKWSGRTGAEFPPSSPCARLS